MKRSLIETILGAVVLSVAGMFLYLVVDAAQVKAFSGYEIKAGFHKIDGLSIGSDVRMSGVKIGTVTDRRITPETYTAEVTLSINADISLPVDTVASVASLGLLGGMYVRLEAGSDPKQLEPGQFITKTKDFRSLEDQVGEIIFLATGGNN